MNMRRIMTGFLLAGTLALAPGCGGGKEATDAGTGGTTKSASTSAGAPVAIKTAIVVSETRASAVEAVGTVRSATIVPVSSQVMGRVTAVHVAVGARVAKGDLLVTIDDATPRGQLLAAQGAVAEAEGAKAEVERAIDQAQASKELAERTYERYRRLRDEKVIAEQEFEEVEARRTVAKKEHERAIERRAQVAARAVQAKGAEDQAVAAMAYAKVVAPVAGIVTQKSTEGGQMAVPGVPLLTIEETTRYRIEASVPETLLSTVRVGVTVVAHLDTVPGKGIPVRISEVVPTVDPQTRTFVVKADVVGVPVRTGMSARLAFPGVPRTVVAVPSSAVVRMSGYDGVFVVTKEGRVRLAVVKTGEAFGDGVEILSGLSAGETVATSEVARLSDGAAVEVAK